MEPLRQHWALRAQRRAQTRAANLALKAAQAQNPPGTGGGATTGNGDTPNATVIPMSLPASAPAALAA